MDWIQNTGDILIRFGYHGYASTRAHRKFPFEECLNVSTLGRGIILCNLILKFLPPGPDYYTASSDSASPSVELLIIHIF